MLPDHTGLLEKNEVYVAVGDDDAHFEITRVGQVIAARNPSYYESDIRKLKVVSKPELIQRCQKKGMFFAGILTGIVLSTKGSKSEAEMMSGGDFDGDRG
jgi:RNA-dependent RNA polymerase